MKELKLEYHKKAAYVMLGLVVAVLLAITALALHVSRFNREDHIQPIGTASAGADLELLPEIGEGWAKIMPEGFTYPAEFSPGSFQGFNQNGENTSYGRTCEFKITNLSTLAIRDWSLVIPIREDLYVNKAWNGTITFSQFGGKHTDTFNPMKVTGDQVALESVQVDELLLFPLRAGDSLTYHPSSDYYEYPLSPSRPSAGNLISTKVGIIFYTEDTRLDLSGAYLIYHFGKSLTDMPVFLFLLGALVLLLLALLVLALDLVIGNRYLLIKKAADEKAQRELGAALQAAEDANRAKTVFLNNMSHDIRTPMNAIIGFTNIALKQGPNPEVQGCLEKIGESAEHLLTLINDVLDISRIESGKTLFTPTAVDMNTVLEAVLDITRGFLLNRKLEFQVKLAPLDPPYLYADAVRVREVLVNILSNAVKYTNDGGRITFESACRPGEDAEHVVLTFRVSDTGIGMSKEFLTRIFDEFSQEENGARTQYKGTGLGMAITKRYVELMGGAISVESEQGKGSVFTVELPMALAREDQVEQHEAPAAHASLKGVRVLLAEDNDLNAEIAMVQLEEQGLAVTRAADGREAVELFAQHPANSFDLILMDIMMPKLDGYQATRAIRAMSDRPDAQVIPIIAMTANAFAEDVQASLDAGMNAHIAKPIVMDEVLKTITRNLKH